MLNVLIVISLIVLFLINIIAIQLLITIPHHYYALTHQKHFFENRLFAKYYIFYLGFLILTGVLYGLSRILEESYTYFIVLLVYLVLQRFVNELIKYRINSTIFRSKTYFVNKDVEAEVKLITDAFPELTVTVSNKGAMTAIMIKTAEPSKKQLIFRVLNDNKVLFKDITLEKTHKLRIIMPLLFVFASGIIFCTFEYLFPLLHFV